MRKENIVLFFLFVLSFIRKRSRRTLWKAILVTLFSIAKNLPQEFDLFFSLPFSFLTTRARRAPSHRSGWRRLKQAQIRNTSTGDLLPHASLRPFLHAYRDCVTKWESAEKSSPIRMKAPAAKKCPLWQRSRTYPTSGSASLRFLVKYVHGEI